MLEVAFVGALIIYTPSLDRCSRRGSTSSIHGVVSLPLETRGRGPSLIRLWCAFTHCYLAGAHALVRLFEQPHRMFYVVRVLFQGLRIPLAARRFEKISAIDVDGACYLVEGI